MKPAPSPSHAFHDCRNERGVALIIVLGFLGLMVVMAVAFMVQARVERMVADSTLDGMRARQVAQTGVAAAIQDYMNAIKSLDSQSDTQYDMFLSGNLNVSASYHYSGLYYDSTNLWNGEASDWLPPSLTGKDSRVDIDTIDDMEWIWVRQKPNNRSRILGRYAYVCFNLSGGVDANLLGRFFGDDLPSSGYGAQTNRGNVRKMLLNGVRASPSTDSNPQKKLGDYQKMWQGFDTPAALNKLTDGKNNDGNDQQGGNRWANYDMDESSVGPLAKDYLSCYSYAATHRGSGYGEKKPCSVENITGNHYFSRLVSEMGGDESDVRKALDDYFSSSTVPAGTDYPSVKPVPMFNEIKAEVQLVQAEGTGKWQLKVTVKPEFWCPFPSKDTPDETYTLQPPSMGGGAAQSGSEDIWVRVLGSTSGGMFQPTLTQADVTPQQITVEPTDKPKAPEESFVYTLDITGMPTDSDGITPLPIKAMRVAGVIFQKPWELKLGGKAVDSTPKDKLSIAVSPNTLSHGAGGNTTGSGYMEVDDPRLNHLAGRWSASSDGSMGEKNSCLDAALAVAKQKMGYEPGSYMYCRNGKMESPAELGYIPVYNGSTPWMTLDIFSDNGIGLMNTLVCDDDVWQIMDKYDVFYTNGTINPYTRDEAVLNGAFYGLDVREVPGMDGTPSGKGVFGEDRVKELSAELVKDKDPDGRAFIKDGPGGWTRVLRYKGFDLNKNQRVMLAHNTWGLFNESDSLFLVFVVAQSITEAPEKVNPVGDWDEDADTITGERWAVALCWMDTSAEGAADDLTQEMDIIMFKYLNE
jgi:hypothetical protein